jgi:4-aminobutyrate aminotransferase-like enzyme/Ser/Thr protein kinase RdoA (MazF antagonist)
MSALRATDIAAILSEEYGLEGTTSHLPGENENYLIATSEGSRFVLKLATEISSGDALDLERVATEAIARSGVGIVVPRVLATRQGLLEARCDGPEGTPLRARVFEFVPGVPWGEADPATPERRAQLGRCVARIAHALSSLTHPAARRTHRWNLAAVASHRAKIALIDDPSRRRLVDEALTLYVAAAEPRLAALPHSVIHGDLNDENVLVSGDQVSGLLDFGDCLYNPTVCDLAVALTYLTFDEPDLLAAGAEIVAAYHGVRPLSVPELEVLFPLICGRLANSVLVAADRRRLDPSREAWFVTEPFAWRALERYLATDPLTATARLAKGTGLRVPTGGGAPRAELLERRRRHFSAALSLTYREPLRFVRGSRQFLFDDRGWPYVDFYNNVCHVGHCHPHVVAAGQRQMARLNTNTRYLYDGLSEYADRLRATLPPSLECCFFVNSGSEANELALRLARTHTRRHDVLVLDNAYHGHTNTLIDISPYKFMGKGGEGRPKPWVHVVPIPDGYRGRHKGADQRAGSAYGDEVGQAIAATDRPMAAFIAESLPSVGGQVIPPAGYFETAFRHVRAAGGVCILDEVQVGFGRVGTHFWAFEQQQVVPDIVVLGKPIGNGHPIGAVITTRAIADSFGQAGMEFFSTFGGNPVSCAIGMAVLDVIRDEGLQAHALRVGTFLRDGLRDLMGRHALIGDVRGVGLFVGLELVRDRDTLEPATAEAATLVNALRDRRMLAGTDGPFENVIKIRGPLVLTEDDAAMFIAAVDDLLARIE